MRRGAKIISSRRLVRNPGSHSPRSGLIVNSLLFRLAGSFQDCCHTFCINLWMNGLKSLKGKLSSDNASLAALSASSLPLIPIWLGSQQKTISALLHNLGNFSRRLATSGLSVFSPSSACITDKESVYIMYRQ